jgi:hypothetical protein
MPTQSVPRDVVTCDTNEAVSVAYRLNELIAIYPIRNGGGSGDLSSIPRPPSSAKPPSSVLHSPTNNP